MSAASRASGFTLLPVVLAMSVVGASAFLLNRSNALNATIVSSRGDIERARYAAEAGLHAANYAIQQAGCTGTYPTAGAPLVDANFGTSAYSAYASAASGSPLTLTATGTHNGASVTLSRSNVYVYQSGIRTYVHQPNASAGIDTYLDKNNSDANFGNSSELAIENNRFETLIRFNLSFFPAGSRVVPYFDGGSGSLAPGALLELYKITTGTGTPKPSYVDALVITQAGWLEGNGSSGANWEKYDGSNNWPVEGVGYDTRAVSTNPTVSGSGWHRIEVTDAVRAWMSGVHPNNGVWLRSSPAGYPVPNSRYKSSDNSLASERPRLTLNYLLPCGASPPP